MRNLKVRFDLAIDLPVASFILTMRNLKVRFDLAIDLPVASFILTMRNLKEFVRLSFCLLYALIRLGGFSFSYAEGNLTLSVTKN